MELKLKLKISPNSSKCEIVKNENELKVKVTAQPLEGKANKCLIDFLAKTFKLAKSNIEILKGETGKDKTILFKNLDEATFLKIKEALS